MAARIHWVLGLASAAAWGQDPPPLRFSTHLGDSGDAIMERVSAAAVDAFGALFVGGETGYTGDFPQLNPAQSTDPESPSYRELGTSSNGFVACLTPGGELRWSTYLGGADTETVTDLALDAAGNVYVTGATWSNQFAGRIGKGAFPTTAGALDTSFRVPQHVAYVTSYTPGGAVRYSTLFESTNGQPTRGIALQGGVDGVVHLLVEEGSPTNRSIVSFNAAGSAVTRSLQLGSGIYTDFAIDAQSRLHLVGDSLIMGSTAESFSPGQSGFSFGHCGYVVRQMEGVVLFAANWTGSASGLALDAQGRAMVVGSVAPATTTASHISSEFPYYGFPLKNALQPAYGGATDAFVVVIDAGKSGADSLVASTFLGGSGRDTAARVAVDLTGQGYVVGTTESPDFPEVLTLVGPVASPAGPNAFLTQLNAPATGIVMSTVLGGSGQDAGQALAIDLFGSRIAVGGSSASSDFHLLHPVVFRRGSSDGFVLSVDRGLARPSLVVNSANDVDDGVCDTAHCSLREAINHANASAIAPRVTFDVPGAEVVIIEPLNPLPEITRVIEIDGTSEQGGRVYLSGAKAGPDTTGLRTRGAHAVILRGLTIGKFSGDGVRIELGARHELYGLHIGTGWPDESGAGNGGIGIHLVGATDALLTGESGAGPLRVNENGQEGIFLERGGGHRILSVEVSGNGASGIRILESSWNEIGGGAPLANSIAQSGGREPALGTVAHGILVEGRESKNNRITRCLIGLTIEDGITIAMGNAGYGIRVTEAINTHIGRTAEDRNIISGNASGGILLGADSSSATVEGNIIGLDGSGDQAFGNNGDGIRIESSTGNRIGGESTEPGMPPGNVISGNLGSGVYLTGLEATGNVVLGNIIGLDGRGLSKRGNQRGVWIHAPDTLVGGPSQMFRNLISGNQTAGILVEGSLTREVRIQGNWVGLGTSGTEPLGNGEALGEQAPPVPDPEQAGILVRGAEDFLIGGESGNFGQPPGNVIAANHVGIQIEGRESSLNPLGGKIQGNIIGLDTAGTAVPGLQDAGIFAHGLRRQSLDIAHNVISGNSGPGLWFSGQMSPEAHVTVSGNRIGPGINPAHVVGNQQAGIMNEEANLSMYSATPETDNLITGNFQGVLLRGGPADLIIRRQSIFGNLMGEIVDERTEPFVSPVLLGVWRPPDFTGLSAAAAVVIAKWEYDRPLHLPFPSTSQIEFFQSDGPGVLGAGQGQHPLESVQNYGYWKEPGLSEIVHGTRPGAFLSARLWGHLVEEPDELSPFPFSRSNTSAFSMSLPVPAPISGLGDADGDGVPDVFEQGPQGASLDGNRDSVPDHQQSSAVTLPQLTPSGQLSLDSPGNRFLKVGVTDTGLSAPLPERVVLDYGYPSYQAELIQPVPGDPGALQIRLHLPLTSPLPDRIWAHDPDAPPENRWIDVTPMAVVAGATLSFTFRDGMAYDLDGLTNGRLEMTLAPGTRIEEPAINSLIVLPFGEVIIDATTAASWPLTVLESDTLGSWQARHSLTPATGRLQVRLPRNSAHQFYQLSEDDR